MPTPKTGTSPDEVSPHHTVAQHLDAAQAQTKHAITDLSVKVLRLLLDEGCHPFNAHAGACQAVACASPVAHHLNLSAEQVEEILSAHLRRLLKIDGSPALDRDDIVDAAPQTTRTQP